MKHAGLLSLFSRMNSNLTLWNIKSLFYLPHHNDFLGSKTNRSGHRTILSDSTTNIESYTRQRIFKTDMLNADGKARLFQHLQTLSNQNEAKKVIALITDSFYCAETEAECDIVESVFRLLRPKDESDKMEFFYGASLLRMYSFLEMPHKAMALYQDPQCKGLFADNTCHMLLMNLFYRHHLYHQTMEVFTGLQRFNTNCYTLAFGALYHINTPDSLKQAEGLLQQIITEGYQLTRRAALFFAMLALNQGKAELSLECLSLCRSNNTTANIQFLKAATDIKRPLNSRIYEDTLREIQSTVRARDQSHREKLKELEKKLYKANVLSKQSVLVFLDRIIPGNIDYKKKRAKRIIERDKI